MGRIRLRTRRWIKIRKFLDRFGWTEGKFDGDLSQQAVSPLLEAWRPSLEDRRFALRHGQNPKGVAEALRTRGRAVLGAGARKADRSAAWRAWVSDNAVE